MLPTNVPSTARLAAGVLPFFDDGKTILLGREFRKLPAGDNHFWSEFGGKVEKGETLAEAACREFNEETAYTLNLPLSKVLEAEDAGRYIEYYNEKSGFFYRMYCVTIDTKPAVDDYEANRHTSTEVGKLCWRYFPASAVVYSDNGTLPDTEDKIYPTSLIRIEMLASSTFINTLLA